jgi:hypothetical protein
MDQIPAPGPPTSFHIRITTFTALLSTTDLLLVYYSLDSILTYGVSAKVLFVSEFMVLLASIMGTAARYGVNCLDIRRARGREDAPAWEAKSMYMFYIDLAVGELAFGRLSTTLPVRGVLVLPWTPRLTYRLHKTLNLPRILYGDTPKLRNPPPYPPGRMDDFPIFHLQSFRFDTV